MATTAQRPRVTSLAPQFLVDDIQRSIAYYRKLGFEFGEPSTRLKQGDLAMQKR